MDGNTDRRTGTVSVFNGADPIVRPFPSPAEETAVIAEWLNSRGQEGYTPHEMGVFVRSKAQLDRAIAAVEAAGYSAVDLAQHAGGVSGNDAVGTMHLAKAWSFEPWSSPPAMTRCCHRKQDSSVSAIRPNSTRSIAPSATRSTSHARALAIIYW